MSKVVHVAHEVVYAEILGLLACVIHVNVRKIIRVILVVVNIIVDMVFFLFYPLFQ